MALHSDSEHVAEEQNDAVEALVETLDPSLLTPDTVDLARFYTLDELVSMPPDALEELWLAYPDRPFYEAALNSAIDDTFGRDQAVSDLDRLSVIGECLLYYTGQHPGLDSPAPRIPATRQADGHITWFKVPDRIRTRLAAGLPLRDAAPAQEKKVLDVRAVAPLVLLGVAVLCVGTVVIRSLAGGGRLSEADATATAQAEAALAGLPQITLTPTPLALDDIDRPIRAGDDLRDYYPVLLEIAPADGLPRVFPVQQRAVEIAEWQYASDPDVASAVLGLVVRPVLGIPYTPPNAAFLESLSEGDAIQLRMSTGQTLAFRVSHGQRVSRQDVSLFEQTWPGIALALLQDPAGDRLVVYGEYVVEQELAQAAGDNSLLAEGDVIELASSLRVTVLESTSSNGPTDAPLDGAWAYLLVDLRLAAGDAPADTGGLTLALRDAAGGSYATAQANDLPLNYPAYAPLALEPNSQQRVSVAFLVPRAIQSPRLELQAHETAAIVLLDVQSNFTGPATLDVLVLEAETSGSLAEPETLSITLRLFNPTNQPAALGAGDVFAIYSPVALEDAFPRGPAVQPGGEGLPLSVPPGEALDVTLVFDWPGEPYAGLQVGASQFLLALR